MDEKLRLLAGVPLLAGLGRRDLEEVGRLADEVDLPEGRVVARQGATADEFFVVIDGSVRCERDGQHLCDLGPGEFFGELAVLGEMPRTATVTTTSPTSLLVVGHREFHALLSKYPTVQGAVLKSVVQRLSGHEPHRPH
jgi:CRP-like cAMP-binding protein